MKNIISLPDEKAPFTEGNEHDHGFGYYELKHKRPTQQDALAWHLLNAGELSALSPEQIAQRIWTTFKLIDDTEELLGGSTASSTVYDGTGNFITATLADAAAFAVAYDEAGRAIGVLRLNNTTHTPEMKAEKARIHRAGGNIVDGRVDRLLGVSRALGDKQFKGVCSDASIDITNKDQLIRDLGIESDKLAKLQIITVCDGFTDGAKDNTKSEHENFLFQVLGEKDKPGQLPEQELAKALACAAVAYKSTDNISIAVQTVGTDPFIVSVFDGHGYKDKGTDQATFAKYLASRYAASNVGAIFKAQCGLSQDDYEKQKWSVKNNQALYDRDNDHTGQKELDEASTSSSSGNTSVVAQMTQKRKSCDSDLQDDNDDGDVDVDEVNHSTTPIRRANAMVRSPDGNAFFTPKKPRRVITVEELKIPQPPC